MKRIWKYPLEITFEQVIEIPLDFKVLSIKDETEYNKPAIYILIEDDNQKIPVKVYVAGTGFGLDEITISKTDFIGTILTDKGLLVWHIFMEKEK